ncbi:branched-chain amino acid ABC transporter permease [Agrobacterium rhizogenes]|uniref:branched-chain amino acid ABC transporter permease n=1 Tax=Rhizobium rhizogenes TaxID=359 RepID=UPI000DDE5E8F|nr:branched-chain amino acid ABC transporter permease [Rhizobium rhizogenes]KAA6487805.1 branched-chain amino acid ABC transporter permease [Agrobacterium sp. ICMP 7243]NTF83891.1 branched-chain amino acid ABC transporter permease [Rhizobium rhizogenes]NTF89527.1 branched-chain amino acid ABC transporter permease [Rhizobium rhizogenes]NTG03292.1 branched-chain amino acid ABC transporter permease [Rhizobium rhizogenes]NTG16774.1 branched-chain amino acid ABC transporter permease [Rhizobium rhiz
MDWVNACVQGILLGGLYALFASGLSLIFGVMRLVNIAHGDFIVLAAYLALMIVDATGLSPLASLILVVPLMFTLGYGIQRVVLNPTLGGDILPPLLVTFGLSIIIQNGLLLGFSADSRRLPGGALETGSISLAGVNIGLLPLVTFVVAIVIVATLQFVFYKTALGRDFRATSDNPQIARLMGLNNRHIYGLAFALACAVTAIAGVFLAIRTNFDPASGSTKLIYGFEAIIIGGVGNLWGTLVGGIAIGIAQTIGAQINPAWQVLAGHLVFFLVLAFRPRGLFPRTAQ